MVNLADVLTAAGLAALVQVILIGLLLAGDNVMVMGTLAAGQPADRRRRVLAVGVSIAPVWLIGFATIATTVLKVVGLLLLRVAWQPFRELRERAAARAAGQQGAALADKVHQKKFGRGGAAGGAGQSVDEPRQCARRRGRRARPSNGAAFGLALSVPLMGLAANFIARLIERCHRLAYIGLIVMMYVAQSMIYHEIVDPGIGVMTLFG